MNFPLSDTNCTQSVLTADPDVDTDTDTNNAPDSITMVTPNDQHTSKHEQVTSQLAQAETPDHTGLLAAVVASVLVLLVLLGIVIVFVVIVLLVKKRYYNGVMI